MASKKNSNFAANAIADATADPLPGQIAMKTPAPAAAAAVPAPAATKPAGKLPRINMAFTPELHDYITVMAQVTGQTMTQFVNQVLQQYKDTHNELYQKAVEFRNSL